MIFTYACPDKDFYFVDLYFVESKITVEVDKPKLGLDNVSGFQHRREILLDHLQSSCHHYLMEDCF